ncbi:siderophore ferric iron reductase [Marinomonas sp. TW1]|uniref:siderophore ferric iron reductase n=1 Tax=Marinomonas sp. TW1 TaxID=1561203 RepID=UPI0007AF8234|nr:siderophore ferric iron reductase [Marinomonas sp. TW1]KZN14416.1 hypothetical protein OA79_06035 [Marinomonas sp. TW1]
MTRYLDELFHTARHLIPVLDGQRPSQTHHLEAAKTRTDSLESWPDATKLINSLHETIHQAHPETGAPYWRIRSWGLLCWQPIYLALICVYHLRAVPSNIATIKQKQVGEMVCGYQLTDDQWLDQSSHKALITHLGEGLHSLFQSYQSELIAQQGGRPILYQALLADQLIETMLYLQSYVQQQDQQSHNHFDLTAEFLLWADVLALPTKAIQRLQIDQTSQGPQFVRQTCCLHFRREEGNFCASCPKTNKPKKNKVL